MATMIPNDVEEFQTEGERVFFRILQTWWLLQRAREVSHGNGAGTVCPNVAPS